MRSTDSSKTHLVKDIQHERYSKEWWREYRKIHNDAMRAYKRAYDSKRYETHGDSERERGYRWIKANPEKFEAHQAVYHAIKKGVLTRSPTCERCSVSCKTEGHHADHRNKLDVEWLCSKCHSAA